MSADWTRMIGQDELRAKGRAVRRHGGKAVGLFHTPDRPFGCHNARPA